MNVTIVLSDVVPFLDWVLDAVRLWAQIEGLI